MVDQPRHLRARSTAPDDGLLPGLVAALVATQVAGLVDHHFVRFPHLIALLWIVAALAVSVASARVPRPKSRGEDYPGPSPRDSGPRPPERIYPPAARR